MDRARNFYDQRHKQYYGIDLHARKKQRRVLLDGLWDRSNVWLLHKSLNAVFRYAPWRQPADICRRHSATVFEGIGLNTTYRI
jgi:hypothetical protein